MIHSDCWSSYLSVVSQHPCAAALNLAGGGLASAASSRARPGGRLVTRQRALLTLQVYTSENHHKYAQVLNRVMSHILEYELECPGKDLHLQQVESGTVYR